MRLFIHAAGIAGGGGLRHLQGFLPELARALAPRGGAFVTVRRSVAAALPQMSRALELVPFSDGAANSPVFRVLADQAWVARRARRLGADVLVSLANFGPIRTAVPHLLFQTNALFFDPLATREAPIRERLDISLRRELAIAAMRGAKQVVTPSRAMAALVGSRVPSVRAKVLVLRHGIDMELFGAPPSRRAGRRRPFVFLCPGASAFYKGLDVLLTGVAMLRRNDFVVEVHANEALWPQGVESARRHIEARSLCDRVRLLPELPLGEMPAAYSRADALIYPTRCESFGFALLEALAANLPVVASDLDVNRELAGDAAIYYDPRSPEALAAAMERLIESEESVRELSWRAASRMHEYDWSWRRHTREFLALCEAATSVLS